MVLLPPSSWNSLGTGFGRLFPVSRALFPLPNAPEVDCTRRQLVLGLHLPEQQRSHERVLVPLRRTWDRLAELDEGSLNFREDLPAAGRNGA